MKKHEKMRFIIRPVEERDIDHLLELSKLMQLINLPPDRDIVSHRVKSSVQTFKTPFAKLEDNFYIFVLVDRDINKVMGVSMIHAQHGTRKEPHFYLRVSEQEKISKTLGIRHIHRTLKLGYDSDGPTEIGGLVLHPDYRKNDVKLGKQLSFIRFFYMAIDPIRFKETIHSELMPPFNADGKSPLWEALGRRFLQMEYIDADSLSRRNKEFILSLFPSEAIYETLLTDEARNAIGKVGPETQPVKKMLEDIGFCYNHEVDPFDGGPHYRAKLRDIKIVKELQEASIKIRDLQVSPLNLKLFLCCFVSKQNELLATAVTLDENHCADKNDFDILLQLVNASHAQDEDHDKLNCYLYPL